MTDYFALLQQPRKPWLNADALRQKYLELARTGHPDRPDAKTESDFALINEAVRVLSDDTLRLQHLLELEGPPGKSSDAVPDDLVDLFSKIGPLLQSIDQLLQRSTAAENALSKSLLHPEILEKASQTKTILEQLGQVRQNAVKDLRLLDDAWANSPPTQVTRLREISARFAYLDRWTAQLRERQFQLSNR